MLTPTEIGKELGISAIAVNETLQDAGMQVRKTDGRGRCCWEMTEYGQQYGRLFDTAKQHGDGTPILQLKWLASVVNVLRHLNEQP